jgi:phytoene dehydrogenase-like protein
MRIITIGSGIAGLTAAAVFAQAGHDTTVFEQYHQVGGVTAPIERDGYKWDLGQLIIEGMGPNEPIGSILAELGLSEQVKIRKEDRGYVFPDFELKKPLDYKSPSSRIEQLKELFPTEEQGLERFWNDYLRFTRLMTIARRSEHTSGLEALRGKARMYLNLLPFLRKKNWSAQRLVDDYFNDNKLKCVFTSILADFFTPPSQFIGLGVFALNPASSFDKRIPKQLAPDTEQLDHYSILGGINTMVDALARKIEHSGGRILLNRPVLKIVSSNGKVSGVLDQDGNYFPADLVIASGGARETFLKLVGEELLPSDFIRRVKNLPLMGSVFMVHLGVNYDPSIYTHGVCTYYYGSYDIEGCVAEARAGIYHEGRHGFVVHIPSLHSPEMAPVGHHSITIYTICPDRLQEGTWSSRRLEYADKLIEYAEKHIPGLREHTCVRVILTPEDFRDRVYIDPHAFGGIAPFLNAARIPYKTPIEGLWFIGAQSESGGGVNNVIPTAYKVAKKLVKS